VESTINQLVARRFVKRQQMRWTPCGAHLLLQSESKRLMTIYMHGSNAGIPVFTRRMRGTSLHSTPQLPGTLPYLRPSTDANINAARAQLHGMAEWTALHPSGHPRDSGNLWTCSCNRSPAERSKAHWVAA
jgi:hypothetical protein